MQGANPIFGKQPKLNNPVLDPQVYAAMLAQQKMQQAAPRDLNAHKRTAEYRTNPRLEQQSLVQPMPTSPITMPDGVSTYRLLGGLSQQQRDSLAATRPENGMMGMPIAGAPQQPQRPQGNPVLDGLVSKATAGGATAEPPPPMFDQFAHQQRRDRLAAQRPENRMTSLMGDEINGAPQTLGTLGALGAGNPVLNVGAQPPKTQQAPASGGFSDRLTEFMANGGAQGLMAFGANLLAASGPSTTPTNLGQAIGSGFQEATNAMAQHTAAEHRRQLQQVQMALMQKRLQGAEATDKANAALVDQISQVRPDLAALAGVDPTAAWEAAFPDRTAKEEAMLRAGIEEGSPTWQQSILGFNPNPAPAAAPSAVDTFKANHVPAGEGRWMNVATGEIVAAPSATGGGNGEPGFDLGNSLDANALEHLVATGKITPQQAAIYAASQRFAGPDGTVHTFSPYGGDAAPGVGQGAPGGLAPGSGATVGSVNTLLPATPPKPTEHQEKAALFAAAMNEAIDGLEALETGENPVFGNERGAIIQEGALPLGLGREFQSPEHQQYDAFRRTFINASLRRESGAAIRDEEYIAAEKRLFPQPGDKPPVIEQKRKLRREMWRTMTDQALPATRYHDHVQGTDNAEQTSSWEKITLPDGDEVEILEVN